MKFYIQAMMILISSVFIAGAVQAGTLQWCESPSNCTVVASGAEGLAILSGQRFFRSCDDDGTACKRLCWDQYQSCVSSGEDSRAMCMAHRGACEAGCR